MRFDGLSVGVPVLVGALMFGWGRSGFFSDCVHEVPETEEKKAGLNADLCTSVCVITAWLNGPISARPVGGRGACGWNFSRVSKELFLRAQKCGCV